MAADGFPVTDELLARLSPLQYDHINFLGRYVFTRPPTPGLQQLSDPNSHDETDDGEDESRAPVQSKAVRAGFNTYDSGPDRLVREAQSVRRVEPRSSR
ncbi:hypothetical protein ABZX95_48725 [Streptomyces sp. NPDC004232]|uniref:hypothetical protein n=1 Tax=Streptomyces sp. NPDC004232 TaxID=3154454 RepID=UPI0033B74B37